MARAKATGSKLMTTLPVVGDFMDTRVHTVSPDTDIFDAVESFLKNHVTALRSWTRRETSSACSPRRTV